MAATAASAAGARASPFEELLKLGSALGFAGARGDGAAASDQRKRGGGGGGGGGSGHHSSGGGGGTTTANLSAIAEAVECCQEAHRARAELLRLRELERLARLAAPPALAARRAALDAASDALARASRGRLALAARLRDARVRPGVPVDPARQPEFSALLRHAAGGAAILRQGGRLLRWASAAGEAGAGAGGEGGGGAAEAGGKGAAAAAAAAAAASGGMLLEAARWEEALRPLPEAAAACQERVEALEAFADAMRRDRGEGAEDEGGGRDDGPGGG